MTAVATVIGWVVIYSALMLGFLLLAEAILRRQAAPRPKYEFDWGAHPIAPVTWDACRTPHWTAMPGSYQGPNPRADLITIEAKSPMEAWAKLTGAK
jgi:hypothetical protein